MTSQLAVSYECRPVRETNVVSDNRSPAVAVAELVADLEGADPTELPVLSDTVDPDVIDSFVDSTNSDSSGALCFTYNGWNVFVRVDGTIIVGDPDGMNESTPLF